MSCQQLSFAGIASFRAACPPSPGRGSSRTTERPAWLEDIGLGVRTDLEGVQGIGVAQAPTCSPGVWASSPRLPPASSNDRPVQGLRRSRSKGGPEPEDAAAAISLQSTSWRPSTEHGASASTIRLRNLQILLPSCGANNDGVRVRNFGRKVYPEPWKLSPIKPRPVTSQPVEFGQSLRLSASTPSLPSALGRTTDDMQSSPSMPTLDFGRHTIGTSTPWAEMKSPRGRVCNFSSVALEYPGLDPTLRPSTSHLCPQIFYPKPKTPKNLKRRAALPSCRNEHDLARVASEKSKKMMEALFNLRRAGKPQKSPRDSPSPEPEKQKIVKKQPKKPVQPPPPPVEDVGPYEFTYTWEQHTNVPFCEKAEQELKSRGLLVEELARRISIVDSLGIRLELEGALALFEKRFPLQISLQVNAKLPPVHGEEPEEECEATLTEEEQGFKELQEEAEKAKKNVEQKETTIMMVALSSVQDTYAETSEVLQGLQALQDPVLEAGGSRHATAIVANRTLQVVRRKAELLEAVEQRKAQFEILTHQKEKIFQDVTENTGSCPDGLLGIRQFVARFANKPEENPADGDKTNFDHFASHFGMHKKHMHFEDMLELAKDMVKWWSKETMHLAMGGAESDQIKRNLDVVHAIGADKAAYDEIAEELKTTVEIMGDLLARRCLEIAQQLKEQDKQVVERSKDAQPQSAKEKAASINDEIRRAVGLGAPPKHPLLSEAKGIATYLEAEEKERYGYRALLAAEKIQERDRQEADAYEKKEGIPPVGPASAYANKVDKEVKEALKIGAPPTCSYIVDATEIAKALRDEDGTRKRMASRAKRLAAEAAKDAQ